MKLYNTLTKKIEEFIPNNGKEIKMYTCGPTVYNYSHIGNIRTYISEDVLEKSLNYLGYNVTRCMNITDVGHLVSDGDTGDDKMLVATKREHKTALEIADFYTKAFFEDMKKINNTIPQIISKATDNIDEYIKIIQKLLDEGLAYESSGNVYFDTEKFDNYYELSGRNKEDLINAVRDTVEEDINKKNFADFGLWFTNSKFENQELRWDSPWGIGYPGWHIECSGISIKYLGEYLDIHCGAIDAIFPHHTNEIAQSEGYLGHKWCNYWIHMEFLNDQTGKMSKSKGDFLTISTLQNKGYNSLDYRYMCLCSHYRKQLLFTYEQLDSAKNAYDKMKSKIKLLINNTNEEINEDNIKPYRLQFKKALEQDLNTSLALTTIYDVIKSDLNNNEKLYLIGEFDKVLSLDLLKFDNEEIDNDLKKYIEEKIQERNIAKQNKDYSLSDKIRNELLDKGILIKDTREGTIYEIQ